MLIYSYKTLYHCKYKKLYKTMQQKQPVVQT